MFTLDRLTKHMADLEKQQLLLDFHNLSLAFGGDKKQRAAYVKTLTGGAVTTEKTAKDFLADFGSGF